MDRAPWHPPWPGFSATGTVVIRLPGKAFADIGSELALDGLRLRAKDEFHVTVLNRRLGLRFRELAALRRELIDLPALFAEQDWQWQRTGERWLLRKPRADGGLAHSVIELIHMPALNRFRAALGEISGEPVPVTPAHVTLFTAGGPQGIGIDSDAAFECLRVARLD